MTSMTPRDQRKLARAMGEIAQLRRRVDQQSRSQNLAHSTIVQGEGPQIVTPEGEVVGQVGGTTDGALAPVGPVPDAPSAPTVDVGPLSARVIVTDPWPAGVSLAQAWASTDPAEPGSPVGAIPAGSDTTSVTLEAGLWHLRAQWVMTDGRTSESSEATSVDVEPLVDTADLEATLATARAELAAATAEADRQFAELGQITTQARADLDDARQRVASAERALGSLGGEVDGLQSRLTTAEGNIATTATEAAQNLSDLDEALRAFASDEADAAEAAAKTAAAADATAKADAARDAAEAEALRLAQAEAAAAQSAAEATAAADALAKANAARDAAISSAAGDATAKAQAAEDAAKAAAAADAKAKADAAQAAAISAAAADAKSKADAAQAEALRLAKLDATAKADAAKSAAIGAAAADAQTKADAARASAEEVAKAYADSLATGAVNLVDDSAHVRGGARFHELKVHEALRPYVGERITVSMDIRGDDGVVRVYPYQGNGLSTATLQPSYVTVTPEWQRFTWVTTVYQWSDPDTETRPGYTKGGIAIYADPDKVAWSRNWKIELGQKATPWSPSPGDVMAIKATADDAASAADAAHAAAGNAQSSADAAMTRAGAAETNAKAEAKRLADAAEDAAKAAAAADATAKANAAETAAKNAAAADAKTKADAAKAAAEAAAKTYADTVAAGAEADAIAAAAADAKTKADAAEAAAKAAAASDAQAKASAAQSAAIAAAASDATTKANNAKAAAEAAAKTYSDGLPKVLHGTAAPSGTAPNGSVWFQHAGSLSGAVTGQWNRVGGQWVSTPIRSEAIANLDVGKLTAGSATVAETVTQKLLANEAIINRLTVGIQAWIDGVLIKNGTVEAKHITVTDDLITKFFAANRALINEELVVRGRLIADHATVISAALKNLSVTEKATFAQAFADEFWAKMAVIEKLTAQTAWIGGAMLKDGAITAEHITATEALTAKVAQFLKVEAGMIQSNAFEGQTFTGGTFNGALFQTVSTLLRGVKLSSAGLRAWDDTGKLTANIDGKNNLLSGVLRTAPEGEAGLIIDPQNASSKRPVLFFSPDGSATSDVAAIYTSSDWDLILRGRSFSGGRSRIIVLGGIEAREGGILVSDGYGIASNGKGVFNGLEVAVGTSEFFSDARFRGRSDYQGRMTLTSGDTTASAANMHLDQYGIIRKSTSAARFKADQRDAEVPDALLDLPVKTWIDRRSQQVVDDLDGVMGPLTRTDTEDLDAARQAVARRGFGVIAEDVEKVDPRLATYDANGRVEGVAYDRFGPALIPLVRRQRDRIAELEKQVEALASRLDAAGL